MALNKILPFADTASGGNILSDTAYSTDAQRNIGHQPGIARQELANKQARQSSIIAAGVAQFLADNQSIDVVDTLTPTQISSMITNGVNSKISISSSIVKYFTPTTTPTTNVGVSIFVEDQGYMHWDTATSSYKKDKLSVVSGSLKFYFDWDYSLLKYLVRGHGVINITTANVFQTLNYGVTLETSPAPVITMTPIFGTAASARTFLHSTPTETSVSLAASQLGFYDLSIFGEAT